MCDALVSKLFRYQSDWIQGMYALGTFGPKVQEIHVFLSAPAAGMDALWDLRPKVESLHIIFFLAHATGMDALWDLQPQSAKPP